MERKIGMERLFSLGQFKNLRITDEISGIPQELWMNPETMALLRQLQYAQTEKEYLNYVLHSESMNNPIARPADIEEAVERLDAHRATTLENLKEAFAETEDTDTEEPDVNEPELEQEITTKTEEEN
jgi:hypothetical protein